MKDFSSLLPPLSEMKQEEQISDAQSCDPVSAAVSVLAAFLKGNGCSAEELPHLFEQLCAIASRKASIKPNTQPARHTTEPRNRAEPAVPVSESVWPDYLVCLEDGKKVKNLKTYLQRVYGLNPEEYRLRWGLPDDYPMLNPALRVLRQQIAMQNKIHLKRKVYKNKP